MNGSRRFRLGLLALLSGLTFCVMLLFVLNGVLRQDRSSYFILFEENVKGMVIGALRFRTSRRRGSIDCWSPAR
jgi:hypothetical protein